MFVNGFEKTAVSNKWLSERLAQGEMSRRIGAGPKTELYQQAKNVYKNELKGSTKAHAGYLSSNPRPNKKQFSDLFKSYGLKKNSPDPVVVADLKGRMAASKRPSLQLGGVPKMKGSAKGSLMRKIAPFAAGFAAIGGAAYAYKKMKDKTQSAHQPEAQVENNHYVPEHLQRDPGFALLEV